MTVSVTISVYSGRTNPTFDLSVEAERELRARLSRLSERRRVHVLELLPHGFGPIRIRQKVARGYSTILCGGGFVQFPGLPFSFEDSQGIGAFMLDICPEPLLIRPIRQVLIDMWRLRNPTGQTVPAQCNHNYTADATPFDPDWATGYSPDWFVHNQQPCNNCYNYANQKITDDFAQPGLGSGQKYTAVDCAAVSAAAIRDGLIPETDTTTWRVAGEGWYVALLMGRISDGKDMEPDYHWIKQDKSGCWSHKLGDASPSAIDSNGNQIKDPRTAVFHYGPKYKVYDKFCGFFRANGTATLKGEQVDFCYPKSS
jgi:hypothetical protein